MSATYPIQNHTLQTPLLNIHYETSGSEAGTPLILLHGWPYSPRQYDPLISLLHTDYPGTYKVYLPTLRGFSPTTYTSPSVLRTGQQSALATDLIDFIQLLKIKGPILVGYDWGGRAACIVSAIRPDLVRGLLSCNAYTIQDIHKARTVPTGPEQARRHWYQFYLNTEAGKNAFSQPEARADIIRFLWQTWSPNWQFTPDEFAEALGRFDHEDWVETTVSSYRHRYAEYRGDEALDELDAQLAQQPGIKVPTVVVAGGTNGVEPAEQQEGKREKFTGFYHRWVLRDVGHCVPVEAPGDVARGIEMLVEETGLARAART